MGEGGKRVKEEDEPLLPRRVHWHNGGGRTNVMFSCSCINVFSSFANFVVVVLDTTVLGSSVLRRMCSGADYWLSIINSMGWYTKSREHSTDHNNPIGSMRKCKDVPSDAKVIVKKRYEFKVD